MSAIQQEIFDSACHMTWLQLQESFSISNSDAIRTCLLRTAQGYYWEPGMSGGSDFYLPHIYEERLVHIVESKAEDHRCISLPDLLLLAATLRNQMYHDAHEALLKRRSPRLAAEISAMHAASEAPSDSWAYNMADRQALRIVQGQKIDHSRNVACERSRICQYFSKWIPEFNRDPSLIFGADETDVRIAFRERVVTTRNQQGHIESDEAIDHLTAMCCHSAGGIALPPFFILSGLVNLPPELSHPWINHTDVAWFGSSSQGWMNEGLFYAWCMLFCAWTSVYRATKLAAPLKNAEILLIVDGHYSRRCPQAIDLLRFHRIKVLILPAHTTHLLQAFDVVLAAPLKSHFKRFFALTKQTIRSDPHCPSTRAGRSRYIAVTSFLRAWAAVATGPLCARSFAKIGVHPIDPDHVLRSPFVVERADYPLEEAATLNNELLTTDEMKERLVREKTTAGWNGAQIAQVPFQLIGQQRWPPHAPVVNWMMTRTPGEGKLLSLPCDIFACLGHWQLVETFPRHVRQPLTPLQIAQIQQRLAQQEQQRVAALEPEVTRIAAATNANLNAQVIRTTAERMAQARVGELLADRSAQLSKQFLETLESLRGILGPLPAQATQRLEALRDDCLRLAEAQRGESETRAAGNEA